MANHHASDVISVVSKRETTLCMSARIAYGAMDMIDLPGERIDCHMESQPNQWHYLGTNLTDADGRVQFACFDLRNGRVRHS